MSEPNPYVGAYPWLDGRAGIWREIARYVRQDAPGAEAVLELGAGYCDFINHVVAKSRCALQHQAQIDLGEGAVLHPLLHVRRQLKLPVPPLGKRHAPNLPQVVD